MPAMLIALALFGCSDDGTACERLGAHAQVFSTQTQCEAAIPAALDSDAAMRAEAPSVYAQCVTSASLAKLGGGPIDLTKRPFRLTRPLT